MSSVIERIEEKVWRFKCDFKKSPKELYLPSEEKNKLDNYVIYVPFQILLDLKNELSELRRLSVSKRVKKENRVKYNHDARCIERNISPRIRIVHTESEKIGVGYEIL